MQQGKYAKSLWPGLIVFLWLALIMTGYFWAHKPFDSTTATTIGNSLERWWTLTPSVQYMAVTIGQLVLNLLIWLTVTVLAAAFGRRVIGVVIEMEPPAMRLALTTGVGLGLISVIMGILGLVGGLRPLIAWGLLILIAVSHLPQLQATTHDLKMIRLPHPVRGFHRFILMYGCITLALTMLTALAPVIAWDSLTYHLTGPRFFIEAARIVHPVEIPHLGFPLLGQMQFTLSMLLVGNDGSAALFHYGYGLLALVVTVTLAWRAFGQEVAWLAGMVLLSIPTLFTLMSWPYVDVTLLFYTTAAFYAFYRWRAVKDAPGNHHWLILLGLSCGFSGGVKYTAVAIPVALGLSLIWTSRRDGVRTIVKRLSLVAVFAGALVLPWVVENWLTTGNPVYPFIINDALYWDSWWAWWYDLPGTGLATTAPWRLPLVPLEATIIGTEGTDFYEATIGPFIFSLLFLLPFVWRSFSREEKAIVGHMLFFLAVNYILWLNGVARTALLLRARFIFFIFGVTAVLGGLIIARFKTLRRPELNIPWLAQTIIALTMLLLLITQVVAFFEAAPLTAVVGLETKSEYATRRLGVYHAVIERINHLPPESEVVFLWETRTYGCDVVCHPDPILGQFLHMTQFDEYDAATMAEMWQSEGVTHVLLYQTGLDFLLEAADFNPIGGHIGPDDLAVLAELQKQHLTVVAEWSDVYVLYAVNP